MEIAPAQPAPTLYTRLRTDIMTGVLIPGSRVTIRTLCDRFGVGLSPMREALNRVIAEGLIRQSESRRLQIAPLTVADLLELTETRCWLEETGLRTAIQRGDQAWEERVLLLGHRLTKLRRDGGEAPIRTPQWNEAHREFHEALIEAANSRWLLDFCRQLFDASERYRFAARLSGGQRVRSADEHQRIADAVVRRNADEAVGLLKDHYWRTARLVQDWLETQPYG